MFSIYVMGASLVNLAGSYAASTYLWGDITDDGYTTRFVESEALVEVFDKGSLSSEDVLKYSFDSSTGDYTIYPAPSSHLELGATLACRVE